jgi:hypothetical protein
LMMFTGKPNTGVDVGKTSFRQHLPMTLMAILMLVIGVFYQPIIQAIYGFTAYDVHVGSVESLVDYVLYFSLGLTLYYGVIRKDAKPLQQIRDFTISFPSLNVWLLAVVLVFLGLTLR